MSKEKHLGSSIYEILLILFGAGGVVATLIATMPQLLEMYYKYIRKTAKDELNAIVNLYDAMKDLVKNTESIDGVLILKTTNGGGRPRLGNEIYATALYQEVRGQQEITRDSYQKIQVDKYYVKMLSDCEVNDHVSLKVSEMPEDALLKLIYNAEGITYSEIYHLRNTKDAFYFMSISTHQNKEFKQPKTRLQIKIALSKIRQEMKRI